MTRIIADSAKLVYPQIPRITRILFSGAVDSAAPGASVLAWLVDQRMTGNVRFISAA